MRVRGCYRHFLKSKLPYFILASLATIVSWPKIALSEVRREATHKQAFTIEPTVQGKGVKLETFCLGPRGNLWMACRTTGKDASEERGLIMVYDPSGLLFDSFPLSFIPQAINFSPNSKLYIAGSGKVARVALNGTVEVEIDAPNIGSKGLVGAPERLKRCASIAATNSEVFVACPDPIGSGYGVWRLSPDLTFEAKIIENAPACNEQFQIRSDGEHLVVAESAKFQVGIFDRNGMRLGGFGKHSDVDQVGFGSSCNPTHIDCEPEGEILTAEATIGHIKRFSRDGKLLSFVGTAKVSSSCWNVAIDFDPDRNWYYMLHDELSHVAILVLNDEAPDDTDERLDK